MSTRDCLVAQQSDGWLVVAGDQSQQLPDEVTVEELVTCVDLIIKQAGLTSSGCVLAPDSKSCFFATIQVGSEIDARDRSALTYELEDHLPIDAESMVADFVVIPSVGQSPKSVAAVAVEFDRWRTLADALEMAGIPVRCVVPTAILAARSACRGVNLTDTIQYIFAHPSSCDLLTLRSETVIDWKRCRVDATVLNRHRALAAAEPDRVVVVGADPAQQSIIRQVYGDGIELSDESIASLQAAGAELAVTKQSKRWFDLRRDQLAPSDPLRVVQTQLRWVAVSAMICLLAMVLGGWWRTQRIENEIAEVRGQQQELFKQAFPDARMPAALLRRVRSEHARVMGSRGASMQVDVPQSAPEVLRQLLAALPPDVRFRLKSVDVVDGQVDLELQVRSPVDAGALATSLSSAGFDVKPPVTTQADAKTFDSILEAVWIGREPGTTLSVEDGSQPADVSIRISKGGETRG